MSSEKTPLAASEGYLLDTHFILWLTTDDSRITAATKKHIDESYCIVSTVSLWEIALKFSIGKLKLEGGLNALLEAVNDLGFERINIEDRHLVALALLPQFDNHKDPFDRLLIAQAKADSMTIITRDENFKLYDIKLL